MNLLDERESTGMSVQLAKRRRGRPRKFPSLKQSEAAAHTPGSEGGTAYPSQRANRTRETECMVGQAVTGFVEATFDSGYLLTVKIGNSTTKLRGVVFKPGHCAPITAENDVAPHAQMIRRSEIRFPARNHSQSPGLGNDVQTPAAAMPLKRKHALAVPPSNTVAPVAPQPVSYAQTFDNGDADLHMAEPLSMLPPGPSIPVGQVFVAMQPYTSCQVAPGSQECDDGSFSKGALTDIDTKGTSQTSDAEESSKSSPEHTGNDNESFPAQSSRAEPLFNYGTGRMTDLLRAFQDKSKQTVRQPTSATEVEFHGTAMEESLKKQDSVP